MQKKLFINILVAFQ